MYNSNTPYISVKYKKQDYLNIHLTNSSSSADFDTAIAIFSDRINGRFLDQIHFLLNDCNKNGFSVMALVCLLIETFAQFKNGLNDTSSTSAATYSDFLYYDLGCFPSQQVAKKFYTYIRCGILHQAQTKPKSGLTFGATNAVNWSNNFLMISVDRFVEAVDTYFFEYCNQLRDPSNSELRLNFIKKMNFICNR